MQLQLPDHAWSFNHQIPISIILWSWTNPFHQVCDTTVPDPSTTPLKPPTNLDSSPTKPHQDPSPPQPPPSKPPPYPDPDQPPLSPKNPVIDHIGREETVGPITCKKFNTPPHHPYQRPRRTKPDRTAELEENWLEARESWDRKLKTAQYPVQVAERGYLSDGNRKLPQYDISESHRKLPNYQPELDAARNMLFPGQEAGDKKINSNPEHFIFPECNQDLQKEFFMFYMQKCLQQNIVDPPPYTAHGIWLSDQLILSLIN